MRKLFALILGILLLTGCAAPAAYHGPTKTAWVLSEQITTYQTDQYGTEEESRTVHSYDAFGNRIQSCTYQGGTLSSERKYTYDDRGNMISSSVWDHDGLIPYRSSSTGYTYDDQNRPTATIYRNFLGLERRRDTYTYDDEARTVLWEGRYDVMTTWLDADGKLLRKKIYSEPVDTWMETLYEYDELGRNTKITSYYDEALSSVTELVYDDQDRILEETYRGADGTVYSRITYHYGENTVTIYELGGRQTVEVYRPDGQVETMDEYNKKGELTRQTRYVYTEITVPDTRKE